MRKRSYAVWYHPEDPTIPVSVHDGETHVCDCAPLDDLAALGDEERAGEWKRAKNVAIKEVKGDLKAVRAASPEIAPAAAVAFADPRPKLEKPAEPKALLQPTGNPGELVNIQTRATIRRIEREAPEAPREVDWGKLAELKRKQDAKRALG
jgi:autotransporter translocation and assembly factor TamB